MMKILLISLNLFLVTPSAHAQELSSADLESSQIISTSTEQSSPSCVHTESSFSCVQYLRNYDGDTLTVNVPDIHPLFGHKISVRVFGIDSPEKRGNKPCEKEKAKSAQKLVQSLLKQAKNIELRNVQRDKYFRILAEVWADGVSVADSLITSGLAYRYDGGTKADINWCRGPAGSKVKQ